jgi:hypothetical protein
MILVGAIVMVLTCNPIGTIENPSELDGSSDGAVSDTNSEADVFEQPSCDSIECQSNSHCIISEGKPVCVCDEGYVALNGECVPEDTFDPCDNFQCPEHSRCIVKNNKAFCECDPGYKLEGDKCIPDDSSKKYPWANKWELEMFEELNKIRIQKCGEKGRLILHERLSLECRKHAKYMSKIRNITHNGSSQRCRNAGCRGCSENVGGVGTNGVEALYAYRMSPGHWGNIMYCGWVYVGLGIVKDVYGGSSLWHCQQFSRTCN